MNNTYYGFEPNTASWNDNIDSQYDDLFDQYYEACAKHITDHPLLDMDPDLLEELSEEELEEYVIEEGRARFRAQWSLYTAGWN